ncbi:MAG: FecR family protein [Melioribacteraceae bacterium]|nr:FecR family protein [Melioribacteraceae bacterium]
MNYNRLLIVSIIIAAFISIGFVIEDNNETPIALIKKIIKDVSYKTIDAEDWEVAKTGVPLKSGEQVKTGFKSLALVLFTDGTGLLRVRENSIMYIYGDREDKKINKNTFIEKGLIGFDINKQEAEEFKFTTPTAVAAIRGTAGYIEVGSDSSTTIVCDYGKIEVQSLIGDKRKAVIEGGAALSISPDGEILKGAISSEQSNKFSKTKKTKVKKIFIETEDGTIELEFYPEED